MINGIFLSFVSENQIGVIKKIKSQSKSLGKYSNNLNKFYVIKDFFYFENKKIGKYYKNDSVLNKIKCKISIFYFLIKIKEFFYYENINYIYIRFFGITPFFINYLKFLKKLNILVFLELPTYPYEYESKTLLTKILNIIDRKNRKHLKKYVDRIVTFSEDDEIFDIKTLKISNGIDLKNVTLIDKNKKKNLDKIEFISVAKIDFWHGIDRFILSMAEYYKKSPKRIIRFHIVGDGNKKLVNDLKKIVKDNNLENYIVFHGLKIGKELDEIYNQSDIGIGSLGRHRSGVYTMKTLKNREYAAKGLPMIFSENDVDFENVDFVYKVKPDETLIDINQILEWYKNLKITSKEIREFSKKFSWDIQMKKVIDEIKNIKGEWQ